MMETAHKYLQGYRPEYWDLDLEQVIIYIEHCLSVIPGGIDKVPFSEIASLPSLPQLFLYLND
jgi:hypothetical protein